MDQVDPMARFRFTTRRTTWRWATSYFVKSVAPLMLSGLLGSALNAWHSVSTTFTEIDPDSAVPTAVAWPSPATLINEVRVKQLLTFQERLPILAGYECMKTGSCGGRRLSEPAVPQDE
jgi:hypothetical protein